MSELWKIYGTLLPPDFNIGCFPCLFEPSERWRKVGWISILLKWEGEWCREEFGGNVTTPGEWRQFRHCSACTLKNGGVTSFPPPKKQWGFILRLLRAIIVCLQVKDLLRITYSPEFLRFFLCFSLISMQAPLEKGPKKVRAASASYFISPEVPTITLISHHSRELTPGHEGLAMWRAERNVETVRLD